MKIDNGYRSSTRWLDAPPAPPNGSRVGQSQSAAVATPSSDTQAQQAIRSGFQSEFRKAARDPQAFHSLMKEVYGPGYDKATAESFRRRAMNNDFAWLPKIEFRSNETLKGGNGAYDAGRNTVYINEKFKNDPARATQVFTEEVGHFLDTKLNKTDTPGDEGEMFRKLLGGQHLSRSEKATIRADNDHGVITVDGKKTEVEFSIFDDIGGAIVDGAKAVGGAVVDGAKAVGGAIADGAKAVGGAVTDGAKAVGNGIADAAKWVAGAAKTVGGGIVDAAKWVGERAWDAGKGLFTGALNTVTGAARNIAEGVGTFFGGIGKIFKGDFLDGLKDMGLGLVKTFVQTPADALLMMGGRAISAIQTMVGLEPPGRKLTGDEITELRKVYGDSIDYSKVEIKEGFAGLFSTFGRPFTHGNTIYISKDYLPLSDHKDTLVHEMGHVWQNQHGGTDYMSEALWAQNFGDGYKFDKGLDEGKAWSDLNPEQQAELMEQAYKYGYFDSTSPNFGTFMYDGKNYTANVQQAVEQIRAGEGAP